MNKIIKKVISGMLLCSVLTYTMPILAYTNEETIYSKMNSSGSVYKNIVSIITENEEKTENTQTETDKELPVDCKVTYTLDGKEISPEELAGKSGEVKIILQYENKLKSTVQIGSKSETVYTPFVVLSGVMIDNGIAKDVKINKGKIINNGSKTIAVGFALPGMSESLDIEDDIDIPNKIEITMQAKNFELGNIMSFATPKILEEGSLDSIYEKLDDVYLKVSDLENASGQLEEGSISLRDGIITLNNGASELNNGAQSLNNGAKELKNGIDTLKAGSSKVNEGANSLKVGTAEYSANSNLLNENMQKMSDGTNSLNENYSKIDGGIKQIQEQLPTLAAGTASIKDALSNQVLGTLKTLNAGLSGVTGAVPTVKESNGNTEATQAVNNAIDMLHSVDTTVTAVINTDAQQAEIDGQIASLNATKASMEAMVETVPEVQSIIGMIDSSIATLNASKASLASASTGTTNSVDLSGVENCLVNAQNVLVASSQTPVAQTQDGLQVQNLVNGYASLASALETQIIPGINQVDVGVNNLMAGVNELSGGSDLVKGGISNLNTSAMQLSQANNKLNEAASTISKGANDLADGTVSLDAGVTKLVDGSTALTNGANTLLNGTNSLASGTNTLLGGGNTLVDGIQKFNQEGIKKITDLVNVDVRNAEIKMRKMEDLSNEYQRFASDVSRDDIKFISIFDSIKLDKKDDKGDK